jgi:diguanylate cyclase (GGDEF)-like protein
MATSLEAATTYIREALLLWWRQPDHFDWFTGYLRRHGMLLPTRTLIAPTVLSLAAIAAILMVSNAGPRGPTLQLLGWGAVAVAVGIGALWSLWWPTRRHSLFFVVAINLCIAAVCSLLSNPLVGLIGCVSFAVTGGYIACFHTAGFMLYNFSVALVVGTLQTIRYGLTGDARIALAAFLLVLVLNINIPFAFQTVVHALGRDLLRSTRDPLTNLLNRRAFFERVNELLVSDHSGPVYLTMTMIDLDQFKQLNDTRGHVAGDQVLVTVSQALQASAPTRAIIGRVGGEEFLVAHVVSCPEPPVLAERLCISIDASPCPVTASVGTATGRVDHISSQNHRRLIHALWDRADAAMYQAKRAGGNQVAHSPPQNID